MKTPRRRILLLAIPMALMLATVLLWVWDAVEAARTERRPVQVGLYENAPKVYTDANGNQIMVTEVGSGVCRVVVWAATQAKKCGLETIEITHHKYTPQYILDNPGLVDATVFWDNGTDYKFKNTKPYDILIECEVTDSCVLQGYFYQLIY